MLKISDNSTDFYLYFSFFKHHCSFFSNIKKIEHITNQNKEYFFQVIFFLLKKGTSSFFYFRPFDFIYLFLNVCYFHCKIILLIYYYSLFIPRYPQIILYSAIKSCSIIYIHIMDYAISITTFL